MPAAPDGLCWPTTCGPSPLQRLAAFRVDAAPTAEIARRADLILLSLPDGNAVRAVLAELEPHLQPGQCVVDTSTSPVALTREIGARLAAQRHRLRRRPGGPHAGGGDARRELSIMVGASDAVFAHIRQILETMGTDVTHCGPVGTGQVVKILNNMLVFENTAALAEAIALGRRNGVPPDTLLATIAKGSGDSFVLRSHGMKSMVPQEFPERAFSTRYAMKDLSYALAMADEAGLEVAGARLAMRRLQEAEAAGYGENYHPVVLKLIDPA